MNVSIRLTFLLTAFLAVRMAFAEVPGASGFGLYHSIKRLGMDGDSKGRLVDPVRVQSRALHLGVFDVA